MRLKYTLSGTPIHHGGPITHTHTHSHVYSWWEETWDETSDSEASDRQWSLEFRVKMWSTTTNATCFLMVLSAWWYLPSMTINVEMHCPLFLVEIRDILICYILAVTLLTLHNTLWYDATVSLTQTCCVLYSLVSSLCVVLSNITNILSIKYIC